MNASVRQSPDRWLFLLLCLLTAWAPLPLGSNRPWSAALLQVLAALLAAGLFWLLARQKLQTSPALRKAWPATLLFLAIPLWSALQLLTLPPDWQSSSLDPGATLIKLQKSLCYSLLFVSCLQLLDRPERLRTLALAIVGSGLFQACYGLLVALGGKDFDVLYINSVYARHGDATGTFINRNHMAGYLELCLPVGIGLMIAGITRSGETGSWRAHLRELLRAILGDKARLRLFLVAMVIALVMTHSRMGNAAFFTSMGISAATGYLLYRKYSRSMVLLFGSMIIIDVFIVSSWFGLEKLASRLEKTNTESEGRLDVNVTAWQWFQDHWLSGSGAGSFTSVYPAYRDQNVRGFYDFAHNDYLQLLGEYGVIGASLFAAIAIFTLWTAFQAQRKRQSPLLRGMGFAAMMGVISLAIHSSTDFNLHIPANAALLTTLCAFAFVARHIETDKKPDALRNRRRSRKTAQEQE